MKMLLRSLLVLLPLALAAQVNAAVSVGKAAPEFTLLDPDGNPHSLSDYEGNVVVLEWVNHGCPFVRKHYDSGNMQKLQTDFTGKDVVWLTICSSAPGQQGHQTGGGWKKAIAAKGMASTELLIDESGSVGRMYGAKTTPHMYVIGPDGILAYMGAIDSIRSTRQSDIAKADNYVAKAVESVLAGEEVATPVTNPYGCNVKYRRDS